TVVCPLKGYSPAKHNWIPQVLPKDLVEKLLRLHGAPYAWFAGQLAAYILRPKLRLSELIHQTLSAFKGENRHVVGVHVRRTDK
ncbi:unnamed protein product, partial [Heterobilharzia americana]